MDKRYVKTAAAACLIMSAMVAGTVCFGFFMDPVTQSLGLERSAFSLYFSLITIVGTVTLPIYGRIVAKAGSRPIVIIGGLWTGISMACFSFCNSLPAFYLVACAAGLGFFGCSYAVVPVIVSTWFQDKQGLVMGLTGAVGGAVGMVASLVFPSVIASVGWSAGYVVLGAMVAAFTVLPGAFLLKSSPSQVGLAPYTTPGKPAQQTDAGAGGATYAQALRNPRLWVIACAFACLSAAFIISQHLPAYFTGLGFTPVMAGVFMSVISAGIVVTNALSGAMADKMGLKRAFVLFSALFALSFILMASSAQVALIVVALIIMSIGNSNLTVFAPGITSMVFGQKDYASIWGVVSMACILGQAIGAPLWGLAYDIMGSYQPAMLIAAVVIVIAVAAIMAASRHPLQNATKAGKASGGESQR